ncbi:MAG: ribosome maturation factor RimP [Pseudohongiella sp.]|jgi:ribosome maturation factor RimP|nr:ribosome maturation factor RimP [Pseudohongiella sp.]
MRYTVSTVKSSVALISELIGPTVAALGLELWGVDLSQQGRFSLLRIYIEREEGVAIEDCEKLSRQVSALLDVEDPIAGEYSLEVSSPGLDRPLFSAEQYARFVGSEVNLRLRNPLQGRRKFKGTIVKVTGDNIGLLVEGVEIDLAHSDIEKANIIY